MDCQEPAVWHKPQRMTTQATNWRGPFFFCLFVLVHLVCNSDALYLGIYAGVGNGSYILVLSFICDASKSHCLMKPKFHPLSIKKSKAK